MVQAFIYIYPYNYLAKHSFLSQYSHHGIFSFFLISLTLISINVTPVMMVKCLCLDLYILLPSSKSFPYLEVKGKDTHNRAPPYLVFILSIARWK